jgi:endonuclease/exonuclease/phosphatase family metal-dependent hydrolase
MLKRIVTGAACALIAALTVVSPADAATATPAHVRATSVTPTTMTVRWDAVAGAASYRVARSASSTMSNITYSEFTGTTGVLQGLTPKKRYYFRVAVFNAAGTRVSAWTPPTIPSAVTAAVPVPRNLAVSGLTSSSATLTWTPSEGASVYRVSVSTSSDFANAVWSRTSAASTTLTGLRSGTTHYFKVRVINADGTVVTAYTTPVTGRTAAAETPTTATPPTTTTGPADVRVGSFNVVTVSGDQTAGNRRPWAQRRDTVISQILGEKVDVIGVQEVNQSHTYASRLVDGETQFLDLKNGLNKAGGTYALTNENSFNCVNPKTSYKCVYQYRGASGGDRILYNTSTLELVSQGAYTYQHQNTTTPTVQYALAYAVLRVKATGAKFLFTTTHLDPPDRGIRVAQWHELIDKVNELKGSLPVINVGDYNTQKFDVITQTMLPAMKSAGYGDVLNQQYAVNPVTNPRAQRMVNGWVNSNNRWDRNVANYSYPSARTKTGNNIDWIFATNSLPVKEWKMVTNFDPTTLQVLGTMPSDHNMIRATITLP